LSLFKSILNTVPRPFLIKASYWVRPIIAWWLKGNNFTDPIDGKSFRKFLPYGYGNQRENALSPSTLSLERHRLLWLFLQNDTNFFLEHIPDDTKAMQELYRVLKPNGMGVFQIPQDLSRKTTFEDDSITDEKERAKIFGQYDHVRVYGQDYFDKLRSIGFKVEEVDYTKKIAPEKLERYALMKGEILPVCYK